MIDTCDSFPSRSEYAPESSSSGSGDSDSFNDSDSDSDGSGSGSGSSSWSGGSGGESSGWSTASDSNDDEGTKSEKGQRKVESKLSLEMDDHLLPCGRRYECVVLELNRFDI